MITSDYHVHSNYSSDCESTMESMVSRALNLSLQRLCFTDHMDYDYPPTADDYSFLFEMKPYLETFHQLKSKYEGKIQLLHGIELGLQPHLGPKIQELTSSYQFDFILGSSHVVEGSDPYYRDYWEENSQEQGIRKYFESILENCKSISNYHVYGHLDYIVRYTPDMVNYKNSHKERFSNRELFASTLPFDTYSFDLYKDIIEEILKTLISNGKGIELNTAGLKYGIGHPHPRKEILSLYKDLGGEILTIGSDAHRPEHIAYGFSYGAELLKSLGFQYYTVFEQGKAIFLKM